MTINEVAERASAIAKAKGFHGTSVPTLAGVRNGNDTRHVLSWLLLVVTEVVEAAEAVRKGDTSNLCEELADVCIRVFDVAATLGIDLERAIEAKMAYNETRPYRHGGKLA
jgi:NTP pyrophosphatase (non-canonical NTP hydrolase)